MGHDDRGRVLDDLGVDVRHLTIPGPREQVVRTGVYQNMWGERFVYKGTSWGPMREDVPGTLAGAKSLADLKAFNWPTPDVFDYAPLAEQCRQWDSTRCSTIRRRLATARLGSRLGRNVLDMAQRPEWVHFLCRKFTDFYKEDYTRAAEASRGESISIPDQRPG